MLCEDVFVVCVQSLHNLCGPTFDLHLYVTWSYKTGLIALEKLKPIMYTNLHEYTIRFQCQT